MSKIQLLLEVDEKEYEDIKRGCAMAETLRNAKVLKKAHWIKEESIYGWDKHSYQCSECGRSIHLDTVVEDLYDYPYCHCGAKMEESENE